MRGKIIVAALALVIGLSLLSFPAHRSGVHVYSTGNKVVIHNVRYFDGTNVEYSFVPVRQRFRYECEWLLDKVGVRSLPWQRVTPFVMRGEGPALVFYGRIEDIQNLELVSRNGNKEIRPVLIPMQTGETVLMWQYLHVFKGTYHLRHIGRTNNVAVIRIR